MALMAPFMFGASVVVFAKVCKYAFDNLTEEEYENQKFLRKQYNKLVSNYHREHDRISSYYDAKEENAREEYNEERRRLRNEYLCKLYNSNIEYIDIILEQLEKKYSVSKDLLQNINEIEENVKAELEKQRDSYVRFSSLNEILKTIQESKAKCSAYLRYLENYRKKREQDKDYLKTHLNKNEGYQDCLAPFIVKLPESYPYNGKLTYLYKTDLSCKTDKNGKIRYAYTVNDNGVYLNVYLSDSENELFEKLENNKKYPFLFYVITSKTTGNDITYISHIRGKVREAVDRCEGFDMEVQKHRTNDLKLQFPDNPYFTFTINKNDFVHVNRATPIGSTVHVYMKHCEFAMNDTSEVTEFPDEALSIKRFNDVPLRISDEDFKKLYNFLYLNNLLNVEPKWKIGPIMESDILVGLILQVGNSYAIRVKFQEYNGGLILDYDGMVSRNDFLTYSDVFILTDLQIQIVQNSSFDRLVGKKPDFFYDCALFRTYLMMEYSHQFKMKTDSPMGIYLSQWDAITKGLSVVNEYGAKFNAEINSETLEIIHAKGLKEFLGRSENNVLFFHEYENNDGKKSRDYFYINEHNGKCSLIFEENWCKNQFVTRENNNGIIAIEFYEYQNTAAEKRQSSSLKKFLTGITSNDAIRSGILKVEDYSYKDSGDRITEFYNHNIEQNPSQKDIINRAYAAQDFFIIQGPPGTGKTTVIKELIYQQLKSQPESRILISSQANVAVDNVIKGLQEIDSSKIVRCGDDEKISEETKNLSFDNQYKKYVDTLNSCDGLSEKEKDLRQEWIDIIKKPQESDYINSVIIEGFKIVSATCTSIDNPKYGLQKTVFDLVIVDEAGKALPGELMIPIVKAKKLILIGDHKQLPPDVDQKLTDRSSDFDMTDIVSDSEKEDFLNKSFFYRLYEEARDEVKGMLDTQFRMPLQIAGLVNLFYDGKLKSGDNVKEKKPIIGNSFLYFVDGKDNPNYHEDVLDMKFSTLNGVTNAEECKIVCKLVSNIRENYKGRIIVVTPYRAQSRKLRESLGKDGFRNIFVNTVDALQGDEDDVVIYCMTRAERRTRFFSDSARLNVAFSRARNTLIIVGSMKYLESYPSEHIMNKVAKYLKEASAQLDCY